MNLCHATVRTCCACAVAAALALAWGAAAPATASTIDSDLKILFIGNSYTYNAMGYDGSTTGDGTSSDRNFDDGTNSAFEALVIAASGYNALNVGGSQNIAVGGATLAQHTGVDGGKVTVLEDDLSILNQGWDVIVIQEYSTRPGRTIFSVAGDTNYNAASVTGFYTNGLGVIADYLKANGVTSDIMLFNTWARSPNLLNYSSSSDGFANYNQMYTQTNLAYATAKDYLTAGTSENVVQTGTNSWLTGKGLSNEVDIAMVGQAFDAVLSDLDFDHTVYGFLEKSDVLYEPDGSHQNLGGEFLTASVLFEMIYGVSVLQLLDTGALTASDLLGLQSLSSTSGWDQSGDLNYDLARYLATVSATITGVAVPEPATFALVICSAVLLGGRRRRARLVV